MDNKKLNNARLKLLFIAMALFSTIFIIYFFVKYHWLITGFYYFELIIISLSALTLWMSIKTIKELRILYKVNWLICALIFELISYIILFALLIPIKFFKNSDGSLLILDLYSLILPITVGVCGISIELPFKYNKHYQKTHIGNFYSVFSKKNFNLEKTIDIIYDNEKLKYFLIPWKNMNDRKNRGKNIIFNLKMLQQLDISAYNRLYNEIKYRSEAQLFWNLISITIATISIMITLWKINFFNAFENAFLGIGYSNIKFIANCIVIDIFIFILVYTIIYFRKEEARKYYREICLFFDEAKIIN